jgi:excisionase family DNA binding protein
MPQYITVKDIMAMYKVSKSTVYNWIDEGLPMYKFGKSTRFVESEVDEWLKKKAEGEHV